MSRLPQAYMRGAIARERPADACDILLPRARIISLDFEVLGYFMIATLADIMLL